jgi:hypothetical protein
MTLYTSPTGSDQFLVIDEATGRTVAIVYTTASDAKLLSYAPQMLAALKDSDTPAHTRLADEIYREMYQAEEDKR